MSGSSGFVGSYLKAFLESKGEQVVALKRHEGTKSKAPAEVVIWNPEKGLLDPYYFENFDAFIHLSGENIFEGRWTKEKKETIFNSRCRDTWLLSETLARLRHPPTTFLSVSAIGYYGDCGEELVDETRRPGKNFLADVCFHWEKATEAAYQRGIRVIHPRLGIVLSPKGGALSSLIPIFSKGMGAILGKGTQFLSWVALEDVARAFYHILYTKELEGGVNVTAPFPLTQKAFAKNLARALDSHVRFKIPKWLLYILYGQKIELFFSSCRAIPRRLEETGFSFLYPKLFSLLRNFFQEKV
jgi:uncharacterized protein